MPLPINLPEHQPEVEAQRQFLNELRSPAGTLDLRQLLLRAPFPVFVPADETLGLQMWGVNTGVAGQPNPQLVRIQLVFVSPNHVMPTQVVIVATLSRAAHPQLAFDQWSLESALTSLLTEYLPSRYGSGLGQPDRKSRVRVVQRLWQDLVSDDLAKALPLEAAPHFRAAYWEQPVPLFIGYQDLNLFRVVVCGVGLSQSESWAVLMSVAPLRANDDRIQALENQRSAALAAMTQHRNQWG